MRLDFPFHPPPAGPLSLLSFSQQLLRLLLQPSCFPAAPARSVSSSSGKRSAGFPFCPSRRIHSVSAAHPLGAHVGYCQVGGVDERWNPLFVPLKWKEWNHPAVPGYSPPGAGGIPSAFRPL